MRGLTEKRLRELMLKGKIKGFTHAAKPHHPQQARAKNKKTGGFKAKHKSAGLSWLQSSLHYWCKDQGLKLVREHRICKDRMWRFDFAIPALKIAVEFEGGIFLHNSGHKTAKHYTKDTDKYNRATADGWKVIRITAMNYKTVLSILNSIINGKKDI
jgi:very-short-patch-repair endonuclease